MPFGVFLKMFGMDMLGQLLSLLGGTALMLAIGIYLAGAGRYAE